VVVDVSVLDGRRIPVRGLTADDFTILEDGKPQPVATFSAIDVPELEEPSAAWMKEVAPDVQRNADQAERRLMVIVLDDATPMPAADVPRVREMGRQVISRLGPGDLAAVVYALNKPGGQEFTSDRSLLLAALDHFTGGLVSHSPARWDTFDAKTQTMYRATIGTLQGVADTLIDLPGRRKALVFISSGLPLDVEAMAPSAMGDGTSYVGDVARDLVKEVFELFRAAQRANVNIYSLDPGGLRASEVSVDAVAGTSTLVPNPGSLNRDFLQAIAENTGGIAVVNTNDPGPGITQVFRENGSYYLIGYQAPNPQSQGRYRKIEVRVTRPGMMVRARRGYFEPRIKEPAKGGAKAAVPPSPLARAIASAVPKTDVALQATAAPITAAGPDRIAVAVAIRLDVPRPEISAAVAEQIDVQMTAFDTSGRPSGSDAAKVRVTLSPEGEGDISYEVLGRLDLKPGRYQLRVGAASSLQGRSGSVQYDLDVPDFAKESLALSGAVMSTASGVTTGPKERTAPFLPVVPTTRREFSTDEEVAAFVRVHQGGGRAVTAVVVGARIHDAHGATVFERTDLLEASRFGGGREADYQLPLPLAALGEGTYLLTIEAAVNPASAGGEQNAPSKPVRRNVRFNVR
jgi:VWFA-related protein